MPNLNEIGILEYKQVLGKIDPVFVDDLVCFYADMKLVWYSLEGFVNEITLSEPVLSMVSVSDGVILV
jgi:hypothetical protein